MTPDRSPVFALALALSIPLAGACDYGAVDPSRFAADAAGQGGDQSGGDDTGDDSDDDGGDPGDGADPADAAPDSDVDGGPLFAHVSFPIDPGTTHEAFGCADCHGDLDAPSDPALLACTTCHTGSHDQAAMETRHGAGPGVGALFEWSPAACITCHPQASVYTRAQHDNVVDEEGHGNVSCSACHPSRSDLTPSTFAESRCTPCHSGRPDDVRAR